MSNALNDWTPAQSRILDLIAARPGLGIHNLKRARVLVLDDNDPQWETWTTRLVLDELAAIGMLPKDARGRFDVFAFRAQQNARPYFAMTGFWAEYTPDPYAGMTLRERRRAIYAAQR